MNIGDKITDLLVERFSIEELEELISIKKSTVKVAPKEMTQKERWEQEFEKRFRKTHYHPKNKLSEV